MPPVSAFRHPVKIIDIFHAFHSYLHMDLTLLASPASFRLGKFSFKKEFSTL